MMGAAFECCAFFKRRIAMSTPSVTILAVINGALNRVSITKTGPTTAAVVTSVWKAGVNPDAPPSSTTSIDLTNCAASADGLVLTATGPSVLWMPSAVQLTLSQGTTDQAEIAVTGVGPENSDTKALISTADFIAAQAFIKAAGYPAIA
jgi:hypothetical protein